ncbi:MAG: hypothetical protein JNJ54_00650 [Myxococcaceae bacterium]|nr:hypothetical protein [Myxococcaceae bacterium]
MTAALLSVLLSASPPGEGRWFPFTARAGFSAAVATSGQPLVGATFEALALFGRPGTGPLPFARQGLVTGGGLTVFLGGAPWTACDWCLSRQTIGPVARVGYVVSDRLEDPGVPDLSLWVQASPLLVREAIPDAPLMPGGARLTWGVRVDLGVSAVAWTLALFKLVGLISEEGSSEVGAVTLPLFAFAFVNHLALSWEWSGPAVSMSSHRFGATIGASF